VVIFLYHYSTPIKQPTSKNLNYLNNPMIGLLIELIISWLLLWLFDKTNLSVLGIAPIQSRVYYFILGFVVASAFCTLYYGSIASLTGNYFIINKDFTFTLFLKSSWWTLKSVLFEELIFRGALLYIAIKKLGISKACMISAIAFGIYHWFSFGAFGNPVQMLIIFGMTVIWGLMFAFAYAKTNSLYLPIGIHLGWNLIFNVVFSKGPLGHQLLISTSDKKLEGIISLVFFITQIVFLPILTYFFLKNKSKSTQ